MSTGLIIIVTFIYALVCISAALEGNWGLSVAFGAYAVANIGILMMTA
jgi:hypothetical protein